MPKYFISKIVKMCDPWKCSGEHIIHIQYKFFKVKFKRIDFLYDFVSPFR